MDKIEENQMDMLDLIEALDRSFAALYGKEECHYCGEFKEFTEEYYGTCIKCKEEFIDE